MNMLGNLAGFVAPVFSGFLLQRSGGNWNPLIEIMAGAACVSASCWLVLDPEGQSSAQPNATLAAVATQREAEAL